MQTHEPAPVAPARPEHAGKLRRAPATPGDTGAALAPGLPLRHLVDASSHAVKGRVLQAMMDASARARDAQALGRVANPGAPAAPRGLPHAAGTVQRKGRVELSELEGHAKKEEIKQQVAEARLARIKAKGEARAAWLPAGGDVAGDYSAKDEIYNKAMEAARKKYGRDMLKIKKKFVLNNKQFVNGEKYYGTHANGVWKRSDGKEYVKDSNGIFISKYVRRELNQFDLPIVNSKQPLVPTGFDKHTAKVKGGPGIQGNRAYGDPNKVGQAFDFDDREFLQQSFGGGKNQFAFSHTATKHPILSNDHKNFGKPGKPEDANVQHGRIVTDLSQIPIGERRAQWSLAREKDGGHKIRRKDSDFDQPWMHGRRDKVISSGYRNMEVITADVPVASVAAKQSGWEADGPLGENKSPAGQWLAEHGKPKGNTVRNSLAGGAASGVLGVLALGLGLPAVAIAGAGALAGYGLGRWFGGSR